MSGVRIARGWTPSWLGGVRLGTTRLVVAGLWSLGFWSLGFWIRMGLSMPPNALLSPVPKFGKRRACSDEERETARKWLVRCWELPGISEARGVPSACHPADRMIVMPGHNMGETG